MVGTSVCVCVCVYVFSSHLFWTSSSLDVPAGVTQEEGHTGILIHLPSAVYTMFIPFDVVIKQGCRCSEGLDASAFFV